MKKDSTKYNTIEDFPFAGIILSSGTPDESQCNLKKNAFKFKNIFNCECSYKEAFEKEYVVRPTINLVKCSRDTDLPSAFLAIFKHEVNLSKKNNFPVTILNCASSIDEIYDLSNSNEIKKRIKKEFHLINLHSKKDVIENNETKTIVPTIDNEEVSEDTVKEYIDSLENFPNKFNDNLPVIIQQVDKISEGVNVKPINSVILSTKTSKRATQQIGRAIRLFNYKNMTKLKDSQANIYVTYDNFSNVITLFENLERENTLTADCFNWGDMIEISNGSGLEEDKDSIPELNTFNWNKIKEIEIKQLTSGNNIKKIKTENFTDEAIRNLFSVATKFEDKDGNGIPDDLENAILNICENNSYIRNELSFLENEKTNSSKKDSSSKKNSSKKSKSDSMKKVEEDNSTETSLKHKRSSEEIIYDWLSLILKKLREQVNLNTRTEITYKYAYDEFIRYCGIYRENPSFKEILEMIIKYFPKETLDKILL